MHLGLGFSSASARNDVNGIDDSSGGYALTLGWEFADTWSLEFFTSLGHSVTTGVPQNIYYPADTADYSLVFIGVGKSLWSLNDHDWTPWIEAGFAYAGLDWKTFYYQVSGGGLAGRRPGRAHGYYAPCPACAVHYPQLFNIRHLWGQRRYTFRASALAAAHVPVALNFLVRSLRTKLQCSI